MVYNLSNVWIFVMFMLAAKNILIIIWFLLWTATLFLHNYSYMKLLCMLALKSGGSELIVGNRQGVLGQQLKPH